MENLDSLIKCKLLSDKKISEESLILWKSAILTKDDKNLSKLKTRTKSSKSNPILKKLTSIFFVLFDKASHNVAIICKRYYDEVILNEIGLIGHGNNTYCKANESYDKIIDGNKGDTRRSGFKSTDKEKH